MFFGFLASYMRSVNGLTGFKILYISYTSSCKRRPDPYAMKLTKGDEIFQNLLEICTSNHTLNL